jgi:8-oxo-dGTP diphosphatase
VETVSRDRGQDGPWELPAVRAAGAICWRTVPEPDGELELLLVRSARWGDWSWPKGKLDAGETLPECAVREVAEETGVRVELGRPLPRISYSLPGTGQPKTVDLWAGRVREYGQATASGTEIAEVAWLPAAEALARLTRPGDRAPADVLLRLAAEGTLDTRPLLVVRHAKARSRSHWPGTEATRPLTATGVRQARALAGLLACWAPERIQTSPWARCGLTLDPYLDAVAEREGARPEPEEVPLLSETGTEDEPDRTAATMAGLLADGLSGKRPGILVCTHRPVLAVVVPALAGKAVSGIRAEFPDHDPWLSTAEILIAHVGYPAMDSPESSSLDNNFAKNSDSAIQPSSLMPVIHAMERHRGESPRNRRRLVTEG